MRLIASFLLAIPALAQALNSPDGQLQVDVSVNAEQQLVYTVQRAGQPCCCHRGWAWCWSRATSPTA
jgi:alpha-glucosidase